MPSVDLVPILGLPWVEGSSDPNVGLDCAGVVTWVLRALGVPEAELPFFPVRGKTTPEEVRRCASFWVEIPLAERMRIGDVISADVGRDQSHRAPHLSIVVCESPCMVASSVQRDGVVMQPASRLLNPTGIYRWPAAARIVGATT